MANHSMSVRKFYVSPETFTDFLLGRDVNTRSIDGKGADHPIFKEAARVFLGSDDEESCKSVHAYWIRRGQEIVRILKHESNVERKKQARLRYFLDMMGLKLIKREEILRSVRQDSGVSDRVPKKEKIENYGGVSASKCSFTVPPPCTAAEQSKVVDMEVEVPECDKGRLEESRNESSSSNDSEKEESMEDFLWKKEGEFPLTAAEWRGIYDKGSKLSRKWTSLISQKFFSVNAACVIQFQGYHFNKQSRTDTPFLMMRGYCAHVSCKRFRVTMKSPPAEKEGIVMTVWSKGSEKHGEKRKTRQLKGWDRLNAKRALAMELAHMYRDEKIREADKSALRKGNMQGIKSLNVLRRARAEALKEDGLR